MPLSPLLAGYLIASSASRSLSAASKSQSSVVVRGCAFWIACRSLPSSSQVRCSAASTPSSSAVPEAAMAVRCFSQPPSLQDPDYAARKAK